MSKTYSYEAQKRHRRLGQHYVHALEKRILNATKQAAFWRVLEEQMASPAVAKANLEVELLGHAAVWERDTKYVSSMTDLVNHPSYQEIIKIGRDSPRQVLSLLLRDMKENDRPWFTALATIAGINPVQSKDAGRVDRMAKAWFNWGKKEGLL